MLTVYLIQEQQHRDALNLDHFAVDAGGTRKLIRKYCDEGYIYCGDEDRDDTILHINVDLDNLRATVVYDEYGDVDRTYVYLHPIELIA